MNRFKKTLSLVRQVSMLTLLIFLIQISLTTGFDPQTQNHSRTFDPSIEVSTVDSGFTTPGATLYNNWFNYTNNPLGLADRDAVFYDGFTTTITESSSGSVALNSLSPNGVPLPNSVHGINYGFTNLQGKVIEGIEVRILHSTWNGNTGYFANLSIELQWNGRTLNTTSEKFDHVNDQYSGWDNNFKNVTLGSPTDLWGRSSWDIDDFSNANFGVKIEATDLFSGISESVDIAWVKIYYSDAPIVIIDPWIQIESLPTTVNILVGTQLVVNLNSTVLDPSSLGYTPFNATVSINDSEVLTLTTWNNDTLLPFNATPYLQTESVYKVTINFSATNGTHWIFKEVSFIVNVIANPASNTTSTSSNVSNPTTTTSSSIDSVIDDISSDSNSTTDELTDSNSDGSPLVSFNLIFGIVFFLGITIIRRKK
ncbi:MAG: hypothetical protein GPJ54_21175 [Candidatus Heimdallarchaeota archaeon]|nr:hypothetical protein [Candidatus Heimdallarchaeota archaeon]